jgi:protein-S-isoprenylcysteine O-methyltransferase Ste14
VLQAHISIVFHLPEALLFWTVYVWVSVSEFLLIRKSERSPSYSQDAGTLRLIMIGNQVAIFAGFAASFLPWFVTPWPGISFIFGTCMLLGGGILRRVCFRVLGKYFTVAVIVNSDQPVIEHGPYRLVRHPSYTAYFMILLGIGIALGNWLSVVILFAVPCFVYARRVQAEEKALLETIGEPYRAYMSRTKRFIPFLV